MILDKLYTWNR